MWASERHMDDIDSLVIAAMKWRTAQGVSRDG